MKILLFDLDINDRRKPFPNLALMKLSAYHKAKGDDVFLNFPLCQPDVTYASCVFTWHSKRAKYLNPEAKVAGSGINLETELPQEIEHIKPDYTLYSDVNFSLGFTSRGCSRRCPWCIVPEKEGGIKAVASIYEFWDRQHNRILLLDNNLLASPNCLRTLANVRHEGLEVDFYQGLDIRLVNDEIARGLASLKTKVIRFAFDDLAYELAVRRGIETLIKSGIRSRKLSFYVLVGFGGDETVKERVEILKSYNVEIYPMIYKGKDGKEPRLKPITLNLNSYHGSWHNLRKFQRVVTGDKQ